MFFPLLALATLAAATNPPTTPDDSALVAELITSNTQVNRIKDIKNPSDFVFNFLNKPRGTATGGFAVAANSGNFPALLTGNGAMTVGVMGPCGANSPHTHPRATEIQIVVQGGPLHTEFIMENGADVVKNDVPLGSATIFPKGSIHFQQNMGCEPAVFIASFDEVDPGTSQIAQNFFKLDPGVVSATLGDLGAQVLDHLKLPDNFILGAQECLDRCKIDRSSFNFSSSFKDFAAFSNSTWGAPAYTKTTSNFATSGLEDDITSFKHNPLSKAVIGLAAVCALLLIAVVSLFVAFRKGRRSGVRISPRFVDTSDAFVGGKDFPYIPPSEDARSSLYGAAKA